MTLLAPAFLLAAAAVAGVVVALHLIVPHEPRPAPLPTARFAAERPVRAHARALRPRDPWLLAIRLGIVLTTGAALAQPALLPRRRPLARILVVDRSRAVTSVREAADSARALYSTGDALVLFDSAATVIRDGARDSLAALAASARAGRLSAALVAALQTASRMRETADSFELAVVSPFQLEEVDDATDSIRALWPGAARLVRVAAKGDGAGQARIELDGPADDPLRVALPPRGPGAAATTVRIARGAIGAGDSAWARGAGHVLVHWPRRTADANPDTVGAVSAAGVVVVAPFARTATLGARRDVRVAARWIDGAPAALEERTGDGCLRTVAIGIPERGDLVLEPRFVRFVAAVTGPCDGRPGLRPLEQRPAAPRRVARSALPRSTTAPPRLATWLLVAAVALVLLESLVRRRAPAAAG